jgi:hypothetical protein
MSIFRQLSRKLFVPNTSMSRLKSRGDHGLLYTLCRILRPNAGPATGRVTTTDLSSELSERYVQI